MISSIAITPGCEIEAQHTNDKITSENARSTASEAHERLLGHYDMPASENPRDLTIISDSTPSASSRRGSNIYLEAMPNDGLRPAGLKLKDYSPKTLWNPIWLSRVVLFGFCALFTALFVALVLLYSFSGVRHGLSTQISRNEYSWTYGPTAGECTLHRVRIGKVFTTNHQQSSLLSSACGDRLTTNAKL